MDNIRDYLLKLQNNSLKDFSSIITKSKHQIIGVSIPTLRKVAKQIVSENPVDFLNNNPMQYYEEVMLQGFVIGYSKLSSETKFEYLKTFIPQIADWSECDCVVSTLKFFKNNLSDSFEFLTKYFNSGKEFEKRFAIVSYMDYFLVEDYFDVVLNLLLDVKSEFYYVNMAVAWALSVCFVKDFDKTLCKFKESSLDKFTFNKTIQKCKESFRLSNEQKQLLTSIKKC